jgi:HK97 family phage prohead protease
MPQISELLIRDSAVSLEIRDAVPRPSTFNADARTVEAVVASTQPVPRQDARGAFHEVLDPAGLDIVGSRGASVLDSHNQGGIASIIGTLDDVRIEGDQVIGTIRFSDRPEVAGIVNDVRNGIISAMSVGYQVDSWADSTRGATRVRTATKWTIREASFVAVGADSNARTRNLPAMPPATGARAEANRQIRALAFRAGVGLDIVNDLIDRQVSVAEAREEILFSMMTRSSTSIGLVHNGTTTDNPEARIRAMGEALYQRIDPRFTPGAAARPFVGLTMPELARECLNRNGIQVYGASSVSLVERALHSTSDFPYVLQDAINKSLRASYDAATSAVRQLARQVTSPDFRTRHRMMLDSSGFTLDPVTETGEFNYGSMVDAEETYSLATFGKIFGISRQAIVNDDVAAFADIPRRLGQAAAAFEATQLVNLLTSGSGLGPLMKDGNRLFHSSHGNVSGTGAAPSDTTLTAGLLAMRKQTGPGGGLIVVEPRYIVVPPDIEVATRKVIALIQPTATTDVNPWTFLSLVVEPRLTNTTRWYLVASPDAIDGLEFSYLSGAEGPQVETRAGWNVDGVETKVRLDFGCGFIESRSWYTNAGV